MLGFLIPYFMTRLSVCYLYHHQRGKRSPEVKLLYGGPSLLSLAWESTSLDTRSNVSENLSLKYLS